MERKRIELKIPRVVGHLRDCGSVIVKSVLDYYGDVRELDYVREMIGGDILAGTLGMDVIYGLMKGGYKVRAIHKYPRNMSLKDAIEEGRKAGEKVDDKILWCYQIDPEHIRWGTITREDITNPLDRNIPVIGHVEKFRHTVLIRGYEGDLFLVNDPKQDYLTYFGKGPKETLTLDEIDGITIIFPKEGGD